MGCRLSELCGKEIVNQKDGAILGRIGDLEIDTRSAGICAMILPGRPKCFGLLGREEDIVIGWDKIELIGADAILVCVEPNYHRKKGGRWQDFLRGKR